MRTILSFLIMACLVSDVLGQQQVKYTYDDAGNRTRRTIILEQAPQTRASVTETEAQAIPETPRYEDILGERKVIIYPNPTNGMLQIELQGYGKLGDVQLLLYSLQGSLLHQVSNVESYTTLDLTPYPSGMYIMILIENMLRSEWKIMKQ